MHRMVVAGAIGGFLSVVIGAFAAHGLRHALDAQALGWIETAVRYQFWHSVGLLTLAALMAVRPARSLSIAAGAFVTGMVLFSGSLYAMALSGWQAFAWITPAGGVCLLTGWVVLAVYGWGLQRGERPHSIS